MNTETFLTTANVKRLRTLTSPTLEYTLDHGGALSIENELFEPKG